MFTKDQPPSAMQIQSAIDKVLVEIEHIDAHSPPCNTRIQGKHAELYALVEKYVDDWVTHVQSSNLYPHEKNLIISCSSGTTGSIPTGGCLVFI